MNLSNLNGIVGQEIVNDEWKVVEASIEAEDTTIVIEELLLALHTTTTE